MAVPFTEPETPGQVSINLAVTVLESAGYRVLTRRQVAELDLALPHQMGPDLRCVPACSRCRVVGLLY